MAHTYTCAATDLITGTVLADTIPLTVSSCSRQISASGNLTGTLALQDSAAVNQPYVEALEASRCVLWFLQDGFPVWAGVVWDWPHSSVRPPATLPVSAQTIESLWDHRLITDTLEYSAVDIYAVFKDLLTYGLSKSSPYITSLSPPANRLPLAATQAYRAAGIHLPSGLSGVPWSASYPYSDYKKVSGAWGDLIAGGQLEYTFDPGLDSSGNFGHWLRLGYTQIGRPSDVSGLAFQFPGNVVDYAYPRTGSQSANAIWATAPPNGSATTWQSRYPHGFDLTALKAGYPALEDTASWNGSTVTAQGQVDTFADSQVQLRTGQMTLPTLVVGGTGLPALQDVLLGDSAWFTATSPLHPPRGSQPGLEVLVRITGWTLTPPGGSGQVEQLSITTSGVVANAGGGG